MLLALILVETDTGTTNYYQPPLSSASPCVRGARCDIVSLHEQGLPYLFVVVVCNEKEEDGDSQVACCGNDRHLFCCCRCCFCNCFKVVCFVSVLGETVVSP